MDNIFKYILVALLTGFVTFFVVKGAFQYLNSEINGMPIWFITYFYDSRTVLLPLSLATVSIMLIWFALGRLK